MKIAFVSTFYPFRGGIAQFNAALFNALKEQHDVRAFNFSVQYPKILFPGKTQFVTETDKPIVIESNRVLNAVNPISYRTTVNEIKKFSPDLVIIGYWMPFMAPSLGFVAKKMRKDCKVLAIVHNAIPHEQSKLDDTLSNYFFNNLDKVIALSNRVKSDINTKYPRVKVKTLHHPVYQHFGDELPQKDAIDHFNLPKGKKYLLFFGLIRPYKGLELAIKALKKLPSDFHLVIAGESYEDFSKYENLIKENSLESRIHCYQKYIPDDEVKLFFSLADACVLPYKSATQSGVIAIAKHFNTPVFSTNVGGLSEFIDNGKNGVLIEKQDENLLAEKIRLAFENNDTERFRKNLKKEKNVSSWHEFASEMMKFVDNEI